ncbi:MAG: ATP-binding protein, partial [bacterium]|nr:ATP-binding protein [bacterium]
VRIELFKNIINSRFLYKSFEIDKDKGFIIRSNHEASCVPPSKLSSGEQHELVLAYQLLFKTKANSLIFIDEPELSLHVSWQRQFLSDISKISKLANLDFLIATHSPTIISDRRDLMVKLADDEEDK